jgi:hypothetical protein
MKTFWNRNLSLGVMLAVATTGFSQNVMGRGMDANLRIAISVHNYANVDATTLTNAENVAAGIFRSMSIEVQWIDAPLADEAEDRIQANPRTVDLTEVQINILTRAMAKGYGQKGSQTGVVPGSGPNRQVAYIFFHKVQELAPKHVNSWIEKFSPLRTDKILGYAMAHELGHVLGLSGHSPKGIMRAEWNVKDLQDAGIGYLAFTPQQAAIIKAEVGRRANQRAANESANEQVDNNPK